MAKKIAGEVDVVEVIKTVQGRFTAFVLGTTPLIMNAVSGKAWRDLVMPHKKTKAQKEMTIKHDVAQEYPELGEPHRQPGGGDADRDGVNGVQEVDVYGGA